MFCPHHHVIKERDDIETVKNDLQRHVEEITPPPIDNEDTDINNLRLNKTQ